MSVPNSIIRRWLRVAAVAGILAALTVPAAAAAPAPSAAPAAATGPTASAAPAPSAAAQRVDAQVRAVRAAPGAVVFGGLTQQGWPVVLDISTDSRRLRVGVIGLELRCTSGASFAVNDAFGALAISRHGQVHAVQSIPAFTTPAVAMTGGSHAISGTLSHRRPRFTGSWRLQLNFRESNGQIDHCDSGRVGFAAVL